MKLIIDGNQYIAKPDQPLYDMVKELGLITGKLSTDPIAAKIAGRVFTLNYVPLRNKDVTPFRSSMRTAMAAAGGVIHLIRYTDNEGKDVYTRTAQFILFLAISRLYPKAQSSMNCTIGSGLYIKVIGDDNFSATDLKAEVEKIEDYYISIAT